MNSKNFIQSNPDARELKRTDCPVWEAGGKIIVTMGKAIARHQESALQQPQLNLHKSFGEQGLIEGCSSIQCVPFHEIQVLRNSTCPRIFSADTELIDRKTQRIRSQMPYLCCGARIIPP
jgi:hypothetical protein